MAVGMKNGLLDLMLDVIDGTAVTAGTRRISLHTAEPTTSNEISGGGYARVDPGSVTKETQTGYRRGKFGEFDFGDPSGDWSGTPTHWALRDGTGGSAAILMTGTVSGGTTPGASTSSVKIATGGVYGEIQTTT